MDKILTTNRLYLRELTPDDAEFFFRLNLDKEVMRYTGEPPFRSLEESYDFLNAYDQYGKYGFGRWAVVHKESDHVLGWCGLKFNEKLNEHDIGFRFFRNQWGKGYATESSRACINYGFNDLRLNEIYGRAMQENRASIRVLEKAGLEYKGDFDLDGQIWVRYKIVNNRTSIKP